MSRGALAMTRMAEWAPNSSDFFEWRYAAGRVVDGGQDFGFVVSISKDAAQPDTAQSLLVQRQDFVGGQAFAGKVYEGTWAFDSLTGTYTFTNGGQELLRWQWDETAQVYRLTVGTAELSLSGLILRPQGGLIPEGGDGDIRVGRLAGVKLASDYHADWTRLEIGGQEKGTARVDMQGLRVDGFGSATSDYDHRWFAFAAQLSDGQPAWVSAWLIEDEEGPFWTVTVARGSGGGWSVSSITEETGPAPVAPLQIEVLAWQNLPQAQESMGRRWRLTAGVNQPGDTLNVEVAVPPGQFSDDARLGVGQQASLLEAVGTEITGTIAGLSIVSADVIVAESTAESYPSFLPALLK